MGCDDDAKKKRETCHYSKKLFVLKALVVFRRKDDAFEAPHDERSRGLHFIDRASQLEEPRGGAGRAVVQFDFGAALGAHALNRRAAAPDDETHQRRRDGEVHDDALFAHIAARIRRPPSSSFDLGVQGSARVMIE